MSLTNKLVDLEKDPNKHLFESSSVTEPDYSLDISPEQGQIHRAVASLFVGGKSPAQIASSLSIPAEKVKTLIKQQHTQEVIKELLKSQGTEGVSNILKATEVENVLKMIEIRDSQNTPATVALNACRYFAELQRGKVPYSKGDEDDVLQGAELSGKVADLDKQIQQLQKK